MKRSIAVLILALALALTACGGQKAADAQAEAKDITLCPTYDNGKGGYFSITLPASWGDHYVTECGANDGGYYVGFYEKTDYDYTELPEYQAICGLTVDGANYNLIAELPTDVQFANENADLYRSMSNDFSTILKSLTFSKGVTRTEVTAPMPQSESDT